MDNLFVLKGQIQKIYSTHSKYINKAIQFVLALLTFYMINHDIGFMKMLANPLITLGLSVICAFLPAGITVLAAAVLILVHMSAVSAGIMMVTAVIFLIMFIFYLRFSPKMAVIVLLTPLAFLLKIPYAIPIAFGLVGTPVCAVPITMGTIVYFMVDYVRVSAASLKSAGSAGMMNQTMVYAKQAFQNKEMLVVAISFIICVFVVYSVRRMAINYAWKAATAAGAVVNIIVLAAGSAVFDVKISYVALIGGSVVAVVIGLILELLFFAVDYSRCESLQYEDDDYYYYVKAIPKIAVAAPEKTVKRINKREKLSETEVLDTDEIRKKASEEVGAKINRKAEVNPTRARKRPPQTKSSKVEGNTEHLLLTQSLRKELHLDDEDMRR